MTYKQFKKAIENTEYGEKIYINSINLSINQIDFLRTAIHNKVLTPDPDELKKAIKTEYHNEFISGCSICPQMTYIKTA